MYTLKSFLARYPQFTADEVLTFVRNTGNSLDSWAEQLDSVFSNLGLTQKQAATKTLIIGKHEFAPGRSKAAQPEPSRPFQDTGAATCPSLYDDQPATRHDPWNAFIR